MMKGVFEDYLTGLFKDVPCYVFGGLFGVFVVGSIVLLSVKRGKDGWRWITGLLLVEYVTLIYCLTVIYRMSGSESGFDFTPFWSYGAILRGEDYRLLPENVMNVVVFVPVGVLLGTTFRTMTWWKALSIGCGLSVGIEVMQLMLKRGFCEVDDVIHNTLGCVIGFGFYKVIKYL